MSEIPSIFRPREVVGIADGVPVFAGNIKEARIRAANRNMVEAQMSKRMPADFRESQENGKQLKLKSPESRNVRRRRVKS